MATNNFDDVWTVWIQYFQCCIKGLTPSKGNMTVFGSLYMEPAVFSLHAQLLTFSRRLIYFLIGNTEKIHRASFLPRCKIAIESKV